MRKWRVWFLRLFLRTVGRLSEGVRLCLVDGPAAGTTLAHAYRNVPTGKWGIGRWIDARFLKYEGWERARQREVAVVDGIKGCVAELRRAGMAVRILDLASGPGGYVLAVLGGGNAGAGATAVCRDMDDRSLAAGRARAAEMGLAGVRFEKGDALDAGAIAGVGFVPTLVLSVGLYELIEDDAAVRGSIGAAAGVAAPGGVVMVVHQARKAEGSVSTELFDDARGVPQRLKLRAARVLEGWMRETGMAEVEAKECAEGWYGIVVGRKEARGPGTL